MNIESLMLHNRGVRQLGGEVACRGKVQGPVRLVLGYDCQGVTVGPGDIVISVNASPQLRPLLARCAAMVTDEGGGGCHAAFLSRELRKPCVMGTKVATSFFREGEIVEVDAEGAGIVKSLGSKPRPAVQPTFDQTRNWVHHLSRPGTLAHRWHQTALLRSAAVRVKLQVLHEFQAIAFNCVRKRHFRLESERLGAGRTEWQCACAGRPE